MYKHAFPLFLINSFDNDDMKSSKRQLFLVSLIFLLKSRRLFFLFVKWSCLGLILHDAYQQTVKNELIDDEIKSRCLRCNISYCQKINPKLRICQFLNQKNGLPWQD